MRTQLARIIGQWMSRCFSDVADVHNPKERALRVLEEAIELAQAEGVPITQAHRLVDHVYSRPMGEPMQEAGDVGVTLMAYCYVRHFDISELEMQTVLHVRNLSPSYFRARQLAKIEAGISLPRPESNDGI